MTRKNWMFNVFVAVAILAIAHFAPAVGVSLAAAVTIVKRRRNVAGARKFREFIMTGVSGNTLDTGARDTAGVQVLVEPCAITAVARSTVNGQLRLTFTSGGAFTAVTCLVISQR